MTVKELIAKLKKFNPDGKAKVYTHYFESEQNDIIDYVSMEEDANGKLVILIHTTYEE